MTSRCPFAVMLAIICTLLYVGHMVECNEVIEPKKQYTTTRIETLKYENIEDFNEQPTKRHTFVLTPGQNLAFKCAGRAEDGSWDLVMYPKDPINTVLRSSETLRVEDALEPAILRTRVYRSSHKLVHNENPTWRNVDIVVNYKEDAIISSRKLDDFSLNFACVLHHHSKEKSDEVKWVRVFFEGVMPEAYGCEGNSSYLFRNTAFYKEGTRDRKNVCTVDPQPSMLIGIYCNAGEKVYPPGCIQPEVLESSGSGIKQYPMTILNDALRTAKLKERIAYLKVPSEGVKTGLDLQCNCVDEKGVIVRSLSIKKERHTAYDFEQAIRELGLGLDKDGYNHIHYLYPGRRHTFYVPKNGIIDLGNGETCKTRLVPKYHKYNLVYYQLLSGERWFDKFTDVVAANGLTMTITDEGNRYKYVFEYDDDAMVVMKAPVSYVYFLLDTIRGKQDMKVQSTNHILMSILPTDPYTYGCGVNSHKFFRTEKFFASDHRASEDRTKRMTNCMLKPYEVGPIGFYCPKGYTLEPPDCFNNVIVQSTGEVVPISKYIPQAQTAEGKNIRVLHLTVRDGEDTMLGRIDDVLLCRCRDSDGVARSTIRLNLFWK